MEKSILFKVVLIVTCSTFLAACGGGGGDGSNNTPVTPSPIDTTPPTVFFVPSDISIDSGDSVSVELSFSDNVSQDLVPEIQCGDGGSFDLTGGLYTAFQTSVELSTQCIASVTDEAGNSAESTLVVIIAAEVTDETPPTVSFSPNELTIFANETANSILAYEDNIDTILTIDVTCTDDGNFADNVFTAPNTELTTTVICSAAVTDSSSNQATATLKVNVVGSALETLAINPFDLPNYANQLVPDYITRDNTTNNPITDIGASLGRVLFYDTNLSTDRSIACANCHQQSNAFSDLANVSQGVNGETQRHSMRLINTRFSDEVKFFWDERAASLEEQTTMPIKEPNEMGFSGENGEPSIEDLLDRLATIQYYNDLFTLAFGDAEITEQRIQLALAQFVRSIQSFDSKYDEGRSQVSDDLTDFPNFTNDENIGKRLFIENFEWEEDTHEVDDVPGDPGGIFLVAKRTNGGFNCASCHQPPEFSIDPKSLNNGFVRPASNFPGDPSDLSNTKSPTLRDMIKADQQTLNGGMFHSGQAHFLQDIFGHYEFRRLDLADNPNLDPRLMRLSPTTGENIGLLLNSTRRERQQINAFLFTLTGSNVYQDEKWSDPFK